MFIRIARIAALAGLLAAGDATAASAQHPAAATKPVFAANLIVGGVDAEDPRTAWIGLDIRLESGWHTYWRSPGQAGAAPEFDWSDSRNVADTTVEWPAPHRFSEGGIDTIGYADRVLLPVKLRLTDETAPVHVSLKLVHYVCSTICTRNEAQFQADIGPGSPQIAARGLIEQWRSKVPRDRSAAMSVRSASLQTQPAPHLRIVLLAEPPPDPDRLDAFVDGDAAVEGGRPQIATAPDGALLVTLPLEGVDSARPEYPLRVTLVNGDQSIEAALPGRPAEHAGLDQAVSHSLNSQTPPVWWLIALSLLGGLILNFMPCVFPVLSLKLVALLENVPNGADSIRARFAASAAGIVTSFLLLGAILSLLKSAGARIGWGIQFQQPLFLVAMAVVLAAFASNLLGLYEIHLPWSLARRLGGIPNGSSKASHFANGLVMTLLATPCSAPFVGTAITFAFSQGTLATLLVFAALGVGMASPYLLLCAVPSLARIFPRPGRWMLTLRRIAAVAMLATTAWLLAVLAAVGGAAPALLTGLTIAVVILLLAARFDHPLRRVAAALAIVFVGMALAAANRWPQLIAGSDMRAISWQPLVPAKIDAMVRDGRTVFVDIGASWCITCKVNEAVVIDSVAVRQRLTSDVAPVRADWTRPNEGISAYLQAFGRYGLPFNAVFGPGAPRGVLLPELLTQKAVLEAFDAVSKPTSSR